MKRFLYVFFYSIIILIISAFTTPLISRFIPIIKRIGDEKNLLDTFIFILTLIVAVLAFLFAIIAIFEFSKIEKIEKDLNSFNEEMKDLRRVMAIQDHTMQSYNKFLYESTKSIADNEEPIKLLRIVTHNYHLSVLCSLHLDSTDTDSYNYKYDSFNYIEQLGTKNDIPYLDYVANHDTNKKNRDRAREVIGYIKANHKEHKQEDDKSDNNKCNSPQVINKSFKQHDNCIISFFKRLFSS